MNKGHLFLRPWLKECSNRVGEEAGRDFQSFRTLGDVSDRTPANCYWFEKKKKKEYMVVQGTDFRRGWIQRFGAFRTSYLQWLGFICVPSLSGSLSPGQ